MKLRRVLIHCFSIHPEADFMDVLSQDLFFFSFIGKVVTHDATTRVDSLIAVYTGGVIRITVSVAHTYGILSYQFVL